MTTTPRVRVHYTHESWRLHPCPTCNAPPCNATNVEEGDSTGPHPGAITLCIDCGHASVFTPDLLLRAMRVEELRAACEGPAFIQAYASMAATRRAYRRAQGKPEL